MTKIQWTDESWNPVVGCTKIAAGCKNCYAERMAYRLWCMGNGAYGSVMDVDTCGWNGDVFCRKDRLEIPLHWRNPRKIFVCSMSDLFHEKVPFEFIDKVMVISGVTGLHTKQFLTKRVERMLEYFTHPETPKRLYNTFLSMPQWANSHNIRGGYPDGYWTGPAATQDQWPIAHLLRQNLWLGVSISTPDDLWMLDVLRQIPAAVRFISFEPLLADLGKLDLSGIHWVIVGGESGPKARPMHPDWPRGIRDQCIAAGVPFFFKQHGEWLDSQQFSPTAPDKMIGYKGHNWRDGHTTYKVGKKKAGRLLDRKEWNQFPKVR